MGFKQQERRGAHGGDVLKPNSYLTWHDLTDFRQWDLQSPMSPTNHQRKHGDKASKNMRREGPTWQENGQGYFISDISGESQQEWIPTFIFTSQNAEGDWATSKPGCKWIQQGAYGIPLGFFSPMMRVWAIQWTNLSKWINASKHWDRLITADRPVPRFQIRKSNIELEECVLLLPFKVSQSVNIKTSTPNLLTSVLRCLA